MMTTFRSASLMFVLSLALCILPNVQAKQQILFHENFVNLDNWQPLFFPKIKQHSTYTIEQKDGRNVLKTESRASASAIVFKQAFNVYDYPVVRWRWRVENVYIKADPMTKAGDDYPLRIYIMFEYDPENAGAITKLKYGLARQLYGAYPPHSSLNYVWASRKTPEAIFSSPYTDRAKMVLLQQGPEEAGVWKDEKIDILEDYQKAFGTKPPDKAQIAVMNDSDNTGESSISYMEYIEVAGRP